MSTRNLPSSVRTNPPGVSNFISGLGVCSLALMITVSVTANSYGQTETEEVSRQAIVDKAVDYLKTTGQADDGSYSAFAGPAVTALVTTALLKNDVPVADDQIEKSLTFLKSFVQPDGGIYDPESVYKNYETSLAILCFVEANKDGANDTLIENAVAFLKGTQWTGLREIDESDPRYGGFGYGKHGRPDLSNTSYTVDALIKAGVDPDSDEMRNALKFISRCQNHYSEHNRLPHVTKNPDGGFYYSAAGEGESKADKTANGGLRSYGSMTYAGLKSMLYAGVDKDDPRVAAASKWVRMHYDLDSNPGMGGEGLYYYYHIFSKALDAIGEEQFVDESGVSHDWRAELLAALATRQSDDGSWTNDSVRWMEGDPNLVTGYALLALSYCKETDSGNNEKVDDDNQ